jgi:flagellar basal body-associated protein FliL
MTRLRILIAVLFVSGVTAGFLVRADDKKPDEKKPDDPVKVTGHLPPNWAKIGLTNDQKQEIYKINLKYTTKIDKLKAEIEALKAEEDAERYKVLTDDQKKKLREIKLGEKKDGDKGKDAEKGKDK